MTLIKLGIGVICTAAVAALAAIVTVQHQTLARLQDENQELRPQVDELARLQAENERLSNMVEVARIGSSLSEKEARELARLRGEAWKLREQGKETAKLQAENRDLRSGFTAPVSVLKESLAKANRDLCLSNLTLIRAAKAQWALDEHKLDTDTPTSADLDPYLNTRGWFPICPDHGIYMVGAVGENPRCNARGHMLP